MAGVSSENCEDMGLRLCTEAKMPGSGVQREGESLQAWAAGSQTSAPAGHGSGAPSGAGPGWLHSLAGKAHLGSGWSFSWKTVISAGHNVARGQCSEPWVRILGLETLPAAWALGESPWVCGGGDRRAGE